MSEAKKKRDKIRSAGREARVRQLAAQGKTSREIAEELGRDGLKVSHASVSRFLREETAERRAAAQHVAAPEEDRHVRSGKNRNQQHHDDDDVYRAHGFDFIMYLVHRKGL